MSQRLFRHPRSSGTTSKRNPLKFILFVSLITLLTILIKLNYQLLIQLRHDYQHAATADSDRVSEQGSLPSTLKETDSQKYVNSLKKEVSALKEKLQNLKSVADNGKNIIPIQLKPMKPLVNSAPSSLDGLINAKGELKRIKCSSNTAQKQLDRVNERFKEWWSHSACPDQAWMENIHSLFETAQSNPKMKDTEILKDSDSSKPFLVLDIGCNKGYTSADFLDALSPGTNMNPHTLVQAIRTIAKEDNTKFDREGGVCNDSGKALNKDRASVREVEVHCFEPSPATYNMLTRARSKLMPGGTENSKKVSHAQNKAKWHIHNVGLHEVDGNMSWHEACASAVGDELCTIVPEGTKNAISVPVITVDSFLEKTYKEPIESDKDLLPLVHMLKIDAEGFDPAVLIGSVKLLTQNRAMMIVFEFNPGLSERENPHGMWGDGGNPHRDLLEVTGWLDSLGYDCYLDSHVPSGKEKEKVPEAPALYRITGGCLVEEPRVRGWGNIVCASRRWGTVALELRKLATLVE